jgi:hypothetical protein
VSPTESTDPNGEQATPRSGDLGSADAPNPAYSRAESAVSTDEELTISDFAPPRLAVEERGPVQRLISDEFVRALISLLLLLLLAIVIGWSLTKATNWQETKELLDVVLPALTALLGSAVGFYFGTKD